MSGAEGRRGRPELDRVSLDYQPALDGVRAVSVVAVLLFHGGVSWMSGGYVGVSVFFTLSGFLITALLLREIEARGRIDVRAFYARRARRLLPAGVLCLLGVVAGASLGAFEGVAHLERDVMGAVLQVANWTQLVSGETYADLLQAQAGRVSPLEHYWSLAIEEQFYWLWPLVLGGLAARRPARQWSRSVGSMAAVAVVVAPLVAWRFGPEAAYLATPARAAEILLGSALACLYAEGRLASPPRWLAPASLGALGAAAAILPAGSGLAYQGGLPLVALASVGLIYGLQCRGVVRTALSTPTLVALGRISFGVYLYHWPVFAWLTEPLLGIGGADLLAVRLLITVEMAVVSYVLVEQPVRGAEWRPGRTLLLAVPSLAVVVALAVAVLPQVTTEFGPDPAAAAEAAIEPPPPDRPLEPIVAEAETLSRPARIEVIGDSTASAIGAGMVAWAGAHPDLAQVTVRAAQGCGFVRSGTVPTDPPSGWPQRCDELLDGLGAALAADQPDVVLLAVASRDLDPRSWDGGPLRTIHDLEFREHVAADYRALTELVLTLTPATVLWVRPMVADPYWAGDHATFHNPEMHALLDRVRANVVGEFSDRVGLLDLRAWAEKTGVDRDRAARPDGVHLSVEAATAVATDWLGPEAVAAAQARCTPRAVSAELPTVPSGMSFVVRPVACA